MEQMYKESIYFKTKYQTQYKWERKKKIKNKILKVIVWWTGGNWEVAIELNTKPRECKEKNKQTDIINVSRNSEIDNISCS